jgi:hypothetical protein
MPFITFSRCLVRAPAVLAADRAEVGRSFACRAVEALDFGTVDDRSARTGDRWRCDDGLSVALRLDDTPSGRTSTDIRALFDLTFASFSSIASALRFVMRDWAVDTVFGPLARVFAAGNESAARPWRRTRPCRPGFCRWKSSVFLLDRVIDAMSLRRHCVETESYQSRGRLVGTKITSSFLSRILLWLFGLLE